MNKGGFLLLAAAAVSFCASGEGFEVAVRGKAPRASIVLPGNPGASRRYAAAELSKYVCQMTGVELSVGEHGGTDSRIVIAADPAREDDGFSIRCRGSELVISGSEARGALYGVYALLERFGCVFCTPDCEKVPVLDSLSVPNGLDIAETPAFEMRESIYECTEDPAFCAKIRRNTKTWRPLPEKVGGEFMKSSKRLSGHTFETLVPPKEFFATHPEYFSEVKGKRVGERSQLCLTNPDVLEIVVARVLDAMRAEPDARLFSVAANDWYNHCTCEKCRAIDEREGSPSGSYVAFINALARRTAAEFPRNYIRASAYMHTRKPPRTLKLEKNVFFSLSPIECDYFRPLDKSGYAENKSAIVEMRKWVSLGGFFKYTDYTANFSHYPIAFPNLDSIAGSLRFCRSIGVSGAYDLGAHDSSDCFMQELRSWVFCKLAWNPDQDAWSLAREFCDVYYGEVANIAFGYLKRLHSIPRDSAKDPLTLHEECSSPVIPDSFLDWAWGEWTRAEKIAASDPALLRRVRAAKFSTAYHILGRRIGDVVATTDAARLNALHGAAKWTVAYVEEQKRRVRVTENAKPFPETGVFKAWKRFAQTDPSKAANGCGLAEEDVFTIYELGKECEIVDDPDAGNGKAVRIFPNIRNWVVQLKCDGMIVDPGAKYALRVRVKVGEGDCPPGKIVFRAGVSNRKGKDPESFSKSFQRKSAAIGEYKWYDVGDLTPKAGRYVWVSGEGPVGTFVDCIEIRRVVSGATAKAEAVAADAEYGNFRLALEYRRRGGAADGAGVFFHVVDADGDKSIRAFSCGVSGDIRVAGRHGESVRGCRSRIDGAGCWNVAGRDVFFADVGCVRACLGGGDSEGEWNTLELTCRGDTVACRRNGALVNEAYGLFPSAGKIRFDDANGQVEYRNVRIERLSESAARDVPSPVPPPRTIAAAERLKCGLSLAMPAPGRNDGRVYYYVPEGTDLSRSTGLFVFLHGGDRSSPDTMPENYLRRIDGQLRPHIDKLGYVVAAPSAPATGDHYRWNGDGAADSIRALIEDASSRFPLDRDRIVLGGHSMGGYGSYQIGAQMPDVFAGVWISAGAWVRTDFRSFLGTPVYLQQGRWDCATTYRQGGPTPRGHVCTGPAYAVAADELLARHSVEHVFDMHEGGHGLFWEPAQQATRRFVEWAGRQRRNPYAQRVALVVPCGSGLTGSSTRRMQSRWIEVLSSVPGRIAMDAVSLNGEMYAWTLDQLEGQGYSLSMQEVEGARIVAENLGGNRFKVQAENVAAFRIHLAPQMGDLSRPFTIDAGPFGVREVAAVPVSGSGDYSAAIDFAAK